MAEILGFVLKKAGETAAQILDTYNNESSLTKDLNILQLYLSEIHHTLQSAQRLGIDYYHVDNNWLRQLKDVIYSADDVLDFLYYQSLKKQASEGDNSGKVKNFGFSPFKRITGTDNSKPKLSDSTKSKLADVLKRLANVRTSSTNLLGKVAASHRSSPSAEASQSNKIPPHLRIYVAYCSMFLKGCKFERSELIDLWQSQGYIQSNNDDVRAMDEVANEYFDELLSMSLFRSEGGYYVTEDSLHEFALNISESESLGIEARRHIAIPESVRHLCIAFDSKDELIRSLERLPKTKSLRTLKFYPRYWSTTKYQVKDKDFHNLSYLRALDAEGLELVTNAKCFSELNFLKYLRLSGSLPESLSYLYLLEILIISDCNNGELLGLGDLPRLRKFKITNMHEVKQVGKEFYGNRGFPSLEELEFHNLGSWTNWSSVEDDSLMLFPRLRRLLIKKCDILKQLPVFPSTLIDVSVNWDNDEYGPKQNSTSRIQFKVASSTRSGEVRLEMRSSDVPNKADIHVHFLEAVVKLEINCNGKLTSFGSSGISYMNSLKQLEIYNLSEEDEVADNSQTILPSSIEYLGLFNCSFNRTSLSKLLQGRLHHLKTCTVRNCRKLGSCKGLSHLNSLRELEIVDPWPEISLAEKGLPASLSSLTMGGWSFKSTIGSWSTHLQYVRNLCCLKITTFSWLTSLRSAELVGLSTLKELAIEKCNNLSSLQGISTFSSLEKLEVIDCPKLKTLCPEEGLPVSLKHIKVSECDPELMKYLRRMRGSPWDKICHIPNIAIGMWTLEWPPQKWRSGGDYISRIQPRE